MRFGTEHKGVVIYVGKPLSGKGTHSKPTAEYIRAWRFATGDVCRKLSSEDSALGYEVRETITNGNIVRDEIILSAIVNEKKFDEARRIVLDGVPRSVPQVNFTLDFLRRRRLSIYTVNLLITDEEARRRRREEISKDPERGSRIDDRMEILDHRLTCFSRETEPAIDLLRRKTTFIDINGAQHKDIVQAQIRDSLEFLRPKREVTPFVSNTEDPHISLFLEASAELSV